MGQRTGRRLVAPLLVGIAVAWIPGPAAASGEGLTALPDRPAAPPLALPDLDSRPWSLAELRGRVVLINFWATWCPPCRREIPSLARLARNLRGLDFVVLAVNQGESRETVLDFIGQLAPTSPFPVLLDEGGESLREWPVKGLPTTFVVDREGRVALLAAGGRELDHPDVERAIRALIASRP
jgi:thiol-disulfide isomerase/thioredoxin